MKTRLALLLPLLAAAACRTDNDASIRLMGVCTPPEDATACTFSATCDAQFIGKSAIDLAATSELWMMMQVNNLLPDNTNANTFRTNTNDAFIQEYDIEYVDFGLSTAVRATGSAVVPAAGSAVVSVLVVPESMGIIARGLIGAGTAFDTAAKVKVKGILADGTRFESGAFEVPLRVCNGAPGCTATLVCAAGDFPVFCPPGIGTRPGALANSFVVGQLPVAATCVTP